MVIALAAMAAAALVQAMVTDGWEGVRHKVARLFGRGQPDAAIERRLDATRDQLTAATPGDLEKVRAALAAQWETRFADLLADHPDAEGGPGRAGQGHQAGRERRGSLGGRGRERDRDGEERGRGRERAPR
jgi:hypothetical protein